MRASLFSLMSAASALFFFASGEALLTSAYEGDAATLMELHSGNVRSMHMMSAASTRPVHTAR